jgi:hypothetical protein
MKYFDDVPETEFEINPNSDLARRISELKNIILDLIEDLSKMKEEVDNINDVLRSTRDTVNTVELRQ